MNVPEILKYRLLLLFFCFSIFGNTQEEVEKEVEVIENTSIQTQTDIISFLSTTKEHSILIKLLKETGLDELFSTETSYTLFAPTNAGFEKIPKATLEELMLPENKYKLINILNYHIYTESISSTTISKTIKSNKGKAKFKVKNGAYITVFSEHGILIIDGGKGKDILIETPDKLQSNGFVHVIDSVLLPY